MMKRRLGDVDLLRLRWLRWPPRHHTSQLEHCQEESVVINLIPLFTTEMSLSGRRQRGEQDDGFQQTKDCWSLPSPTHSKQWQAHRSKMGPRQLLLRRLEAAPPISEGQRLPYRVASVFKCRKDVCWTFVSTGPKHSWKVPCTFWDPF